MVRGAPYSAGPAGCWNQVAEHSSALAIGVGRMASSLDPTVRRVANDLAVHCVAATVLVQVDSPKPLSLVCSGNCRVGCLCTRQLGTRTLGARTISVAATCELLSCCDYFAAVRSAWGESSR